MELVYLVAIVRKAEKDKYVNFFRRNNVFVFEKSGKGTATDDMLSLLGIKNREKTVIISMMPWKMARHMLSILHGSLSIEKPNSGVAFTVHFDALAGGKLIHYFKEKEEIKLSQIHQEILMEKNNKYEVLIALAAKGHVDKVMRIANAHGARGGTAMSALNANPKESSRFFGVEIGEQKEIIYMLVEKENKDPVMKAIAKEAGPSTPTRCVIFSIPVSGVAGIE